MNNPEVLEKSPLADVSAIEIEPAETVLDWGKTLVVAPHPDDESLGCGGAIALLREFKREVSVLIVSDGTQSHPNSAKYPPRRLRDLREKEMLAALEVLGVGRDAATFFRYPDRRVPNRDAADYEDAVERCANYLNETRAETILVPWRRDPHPDHRAVYALVEAANRNRARLLEYPIWLWEIAERADAPAAEEVWARRLDISRVSAKKQRAVRAHLSQTTDLIDDDPHGFRLTEDILANFAADYEIYLEAKPR